MLKFTFFVPMQKYHFFMFVFFSVFFLREVLEIVQHNMKHSTLLDKLLFLIIVFLLFFWLRNWLTCHNMAPCTLFNYIIFFSVFVLCFARRPSNCLSRDVTWHTALWRPHHNDGDDNHAMCDDQ